MTIMIMTLELFTGAFFGSVLLSIWLDDDSNEAAISPMISGWFQQYAAQATYMTLIEGLLKFHGIDGSAPFAEAVFEEIPASLLKDSSAESVERTTSSKYGSEARKTTRSNTLSGS